MCPGRGYWTPVSSCLSLFFPSCHREQTSSTTCPGHHVLPRHRAKNNAADQPCPETSETVDQNKSFLLECCLSQIFCYSDKKLTLLPKQFSRNLNFSLSLNQRLKKWWKEKCLKFIPMVNIRQILILSARKKETDLKKKKTTYIHSLKYSFSPITNQMQFCLMGKHNKLVKSNSYKTTAHLKCCGRKIIVTMIKTKGNLFVALFIPLSPC